MNQLSFLAPAQAKPDHASDEWYTPWRFFSRLDAEFHFTLDPCATPESAKCARFFTAAEDGLTRSWEGERVFCNPPYSDLARWVPKARREAERAELVVLLVPSWTDRKWWHRCIEWERRFHSPPRVELRFLEGRLAFGYPGAPGGGGAGTFPLVLVVWQRSFFLTSGDATPPLTARTAPS